VVKIQVKFLCVVMLCSVVVGYQLFGGPSCHKVTTQKTSTRDLVFLKFQQWCQFALESSEVAYSEEGHWICQRCYYLAVWVVFPGLFRQGKIVWVL